MLCLLAAAFKCWSCMQLKTLDVSHNQLEMLPEELRQCLRLQTLLVNNNHLTTLPQPWTCPLVSHHPSPALDLSTGKSPPLPGPGPVHW